MTNPHATVKLTAPAKLTLSLRIRGVRADGYHLLEAEMVTLDLADELMVTPKPASSPNNLEIINQAAGASQLTAASGNLVTKALELAGRKADVTLYKSIPPEAGLGGGSADAAAILRWAGESNLKRAATLGADVPFCLVGGRAKVTGIGETIEPLPYRSETYTLLTPPFGCSTAAVYKAWDDMGGPQGEMGNDLEPAALKVEPRLERYRDQLAQASGQQPRLAGSGSTWFVKGAFPGEGRLVAQTLPQLVTSVGQLGQLPQN